MPIGATIEEMMLATAILLLAGVLASKASYRLGVPALLFFIAVGMIAGSEGPGGIPYDDPLSAQFLAVVALAFILFGGGLETVHLRHLDVHQNQIKRFPLNKFTGFPSICDELHLVSHPFEHLFHHAPVYGVVFHYQDASRAGRLR